MNTFNSDYWALIIGGSSGFGLATAHKLVQHGMNLCIVHRDRRGAMKRIEPSFEKLKSTGVKVITFNLDGLSSDGRTEVLNGLMEKLDEKGKVRLVLHAVAFGNLKLLAPYNPSKSSQLTRDKLAEESGVSSEIFDHAVEKIFKENNDPLYPLADPPKYNSNLLLEKDDFIRTIQAMGSNIVEWVQDIFKRGMFAEDARVLSLTSEGNTLAWRGYAAVSAAKAVLESVSRAIAVEFASFGIRSNVIQAGVTDTAALRAIPGNRHIRAHAAMRNPFGRLTTPQDVANVIFLLCLDEAAWVNGSIICADGGERIG